MDVRLSLFASTMLWSPPEVPSLPLAQTACLETEEGTGKQGAMNHGAPASTGSALLLWVTNEKEIGILLESRINAALWLPKPCFLCPWSCGCQRNKHGVFVYFTDSLLFLLQAGG